MTGLVINEVGCRDGDFIEVANVLPSTPILLDGWTLTDDPKLEGHTYTFGAVLIQPGELIAVPRQTDAVVGLTFGIGCGVDTVTVMNPRREAVDSVDVPELKANTSWGRFPDGIGPFVTTARTVGKPNTLPRDPADVVFSDTTLSIDIFITDEAVDALVGAPRAWVPANVVVALPDGNVTVPSSVRLKGNFSFRDLNGKAAFKLDFNRVDRAARFLGLKGLVLNNMVQDPSHAHEKIGYAIFRAASVPAPRAGHAWVRVNGEVFGLYSLIEPVDDVFLERHFDSTQHLYELTGRDLVSGDIPFVEVDEGSETDRGDLEALVAAVDSPDEQWITEMEKVTDLEELLRMWAVELFIGHRDGYVGNTNNYFIHSDAAGRFSFLPWGIDQTFDTEMAYFTGKGVAFQRCMGLAPCQDRFVTAMTTVVGAVESGGIVAKVSALTARIADDIARDPRREDDLEDVAEATASFGAFVERRIARTSEIIACRAAGAPDRDGDGVSCIEDCDDDDRTIYPGAHDTCDDDIDQDCSSRADDGIGCMRICGRLSWRGRDYWECWREWTQPDAAAHCAALGGRLAVPNTPAELAFFNDHTFFQFATVWAGLTDKEEEGSFVDDDGDPLAWSPWGSGEPNNWGETGEDCAAMRIGSSLNDVSCGVLGWTLCEMGCENGDVDADGDHRTACGSDCDDDDNTTYLGAEELCDHVDHDCSGSPYDVSGCTAGCTALEVAGLDATYCPQKVDWDEARVVCQALGKDLVHLATLSEQHALVAAAFAVDGAASIWLGLNDRASDGAYVWTDGSGVTFTAWADNQPNGGTGQNCVRLQDEGTWNDTNCGAEYSFVCR